MSVAHININDILGTIIPNEFSYMYYYIFIVQRIMIDMIGSLLVCLFDYLFTCLLIILTIFWSGLLFAFSLLLLFIIDWEKINAELFHYRGRRNQVFMYYYLIQKYIP